MAGFTSSFCENKITIKYCLFGANQTKTAIRLSAPVPWHHFPSQAIRDTRPVVAFLIFINDLRFSETIRPVRLRVIGTTGTAILKGEQTKI
jgi:hypothetical protein